MLYRNDKIIEYFCETNLLSDSKEEYGMFWMMNLCSTKSNWNIHEIKSKKNTNVYVWVNKNLCNQLFLLYGPRPWL